MLMRLFSNLETKGPWNWTFSNQLSFASIEVEDPKNRFFAKEALKSCSEILVDGMTGLAGPNDDLYVFAA